MTTIDKLKKFITDNKLSFEYGCRNNDSVVLSGYALHLKLTTTDLLKKAITEACPDREAGWEDELERVFDYAKSNNYGDWWKSEHAKMQYSF